MQIRQPVRTTARVSVDARISTKLVVYPPVHLLRWSNGKVGNIRCDADGWSFAIDGNDDVRSIHSDLFFAIAEAKECGAEYFFK